MELFLLYSSYRILRISPQFHRALLGTKALSNPFLLFQLLQLIKEMPHNLYSVGLRHILLCHNRICDFFGHLFRPYSLAIITFPAFDSILYQNITRRLGGNAPFMLN